MPNLDAAGRNLEDLGLAFGDLGQGFRKGGVLEREVFACCLKWGNSLTWHQTEILSTWKADLVIRKLQLPSE